MSKRGGSEQSYTNGGWSTGTELPSYMSQTPPGSNGVTRRTLTDDDTTKPKPGRIRRRQPLVQSTKKAKTSFVTTFYYKWIAGFATSYATLGTAILLWYLLGVVSIGTTKVLLQEGARPLWLTLQQLFFGSNLLRFLLQMNSLGSSGLQPWPKPSQQSPVRRLQRQQQHEGQGFLPSLPTKDLVLTGAFFCLGFLATNYSFQKSSAAFVETIKAAEPITSAATAVAWGIETLSISEGTSLGVVVLGVLMSTLGNTHGGHGTATTADNIRACAIVMTANLCFSFRGLHQKLFRASPIGNANVVDDLNLQYRMQQIGMSILVVPVLFWDMPSLLRTLWNGVSFSSMVHYLGLALVNGFAFTCYNLASTFVLTRISVVHHAALNCLRRIFAIVVTSILFSIPISSLGMTGVMVSFCGFMAFTHYKAQRQKEPKPISTLLPMSAV